MNYDYIIAGGGCSGLSLLVRMIESKQFIDKRIALIDKDLKKANDRTWCFWEASPGLFEPIVCKSWEHLYFHGKGFSKLLDMAPYRYKMIRGGDFYAYAHSLIEKQPNIEIIKGLIKSIQNHDGHVEVQVSDHSFRGTYVFNSVLLQLPILKNYHSLQQHFKGWFVRTEKPTFSASSATLMDFRVPQKNGATFFYVLPFDEHHALVEYTLFSPDLLPMQEYDHALRAYLNEFLRIDQYEIEHAEFGAIPMTNFSFPSREGNIINMGTAGGQTKASSGYTFQFIQKQTARIVNTLMKSGKPPSSRQNSWRFSFYDAVLLHILAKRKLEGQAVFTDLFKNGDTKTVLKFLDNETNLAEDMKIMSRLPQRLFAATALQELFRIR